MKHYVLGKIVDLVAEMVVGHMMADCLVGSRCNMNREKVAFHRSPADCSLLAPCLHHLVQSVDLVPVVHLLQRLVVVGNMVLGYIPQAHVRLCLHRRSLKYGRYRTLCQEGPLVPDLERAHCDDESVWLAFAPFRIHCLIQCRRDQCRSRGDDDHFGHHGASDRRGASGRHLYACFCFFPSCALLLLVVSCDQPL